MKQHECATTKRCSKCSEEKELSQFYRQMGHCKDCGKKYLKQWRLDNPEKHKAQTLRHYANTSERFKRYSIEYHANNTELVNAKKRDSYKKADKSVINERRRKLYHTSDKFNDIIKAGNSVRHKRLKQSIPAWISIDDIKPFYQEAQRLTKETGKMHHVDHIIPLQGKTISGLTVPSNLQVLLGSDNSKKNNRVEDIV